MHRPLMHPSSQNIFPVHLSDHLTVVPSTVPTVRTSAISASVTILLTYSGSSVEVISLAAILNITTMQSMPRCIYFA